MTKKDKYYAATGIAALVLLLWSNARQYILTAIFTFLALIFPPILVGICVYAIWKLLTGETARQFAKRSSKEDKPESAPEPQPEPAE